MKRQKQLFKDFKYLIIGNFGSKILNFLLVPLYTAFLTTEEYGVYDIISVTITLLIPILTMGIMDAPARFLLDKKSNRRDIVSIATKICFYGTVVFVILLTLNKIMGVLPLFNDFYYYIITFFVVEVLYELGQSLARGMDRLYDIAIAGFVCSATVLFLNVIFLVTLNMGLNGYFLANIIAVLVAAVYLFVRTKLLKYFSTKPDNKKTRKEMVLYSRPLVLNSIGWWINNVSDRYIVTFICGVAANGIYSVAYKIPSILSIVQSIFGQAWMISAVKAFLDKKRDEYFSKIYKVYNYLNIVVCTLIIFANNLISAVLYQGDFYVAWVYTPYLIVSVVFGAMSGVLGGILAGPKDTKTMGYTTIVGAAVNVVLSIALTFLMGPMGAAVATMVSYFVVWILRFVRCKKYVKLNVNLAKDILCYIILVAQATVALMESPVKYIIEALCAVSIFILQREALGYVREEVMKKLGRKQ